MATKNSCGDCSQREISRRGTCFSTLQWRKWGREKEGDEEEKRREMGRRKGGRWLGGEEEEGDGKERRVRDNQCWKCIAVHVADQKSLHTIPVILLSNKTQ